MKKIISLVLAMVVLSATAFADKFDSADVNNVGCINANADAGVIARVSLPVEFATDGDGLYAHPVEWAFDASVCCQPTGAFAGTAEYSAAGFAQDGFVRLGQTPAESALDAALLTGNVPVYGVEVLNSSAVMADDYVSAAWGEVLRAESGAEEFYELLTWELIARVTRVDDYSIDGFSVREAMSLRAEEYDFQLHGEPIARLWLEEPQAGARAFWNVYERKLVDELGYEWTFWTLCFGTGAPAKPQGQAVAYVPQPQTVNVDPATVWEPVDTTESTTPTETPWDPSFNFDEEPSAPVNTDPQTVWEEPSAPAQTEVAQAESWDTAFNFVDEEPETAPVNTDPQTVWEDTTVSSHTVSQGQANPATVWEEPSAPAQTESQASTWDEGFNF